MYNRVIREVKSKKETYSVTLTFDEEGNLLLHKSSCTCIFGSWWRFAGHWKRKEKLCWHMVKVIKEIENGKKNKRR